MKTEPAIYGLKALSFAFLASAAAFTAAIAVYSGEPWAVGVRIVAHRAAPYVAAAGAYLDDKALAPAADRVVHYDRAFFDWLNPPPPRPPAPRLAARAAAKPPVAAAARTVPPLKPAIEEDLANRSPPPQAAEPPPQDAHPPGPTELARAMDHFKISLSKELFENFELFLYVSKAERGPWAQRMYVIRKAADGKLNLLYDWPVSTGREIVEPNYAGKMLQTYTPQGYYQLDPGRMYVRYRSQQWQHPMPYAMFFNWEHDGLQTGLAIHSADGADVALLGKRSSAGCVRLAPQNAARLFNLVKQNYRGSVPRFAYDVHTATMHNDGLLMRDKDGKLRYADGYKVLVFIENNGGENIVAALF
jgi:lipoprotein-anchoring transpeptidase ErfK/SrfK